MTRVVFPDTLPQTMTNAVLRVYGKAISDGFASIGWVLADTNIDWLTIAYWVGANDNQQHPVGYEIWGMGDALQATYPFYLKIEYGSYGSIIPGVWLTLGTNHSGGNITGQVGGRIFVTQGQLATTTLYSTLMSGNTSRVTVCLWAMAGNVVAYQYPIYFNIERTLDASAAYTNAGATIHVCNFVGSRFCQYVPSSGTILGVTSMFNSVITPSSNTTVGTYTYLSPVRCFTPAESNPILGCATFLFTDICSSAYISVLDWAGNPHEYVTLSNVSSGTTLVYGRGSTLTGLAVLWE